ncbi:hypothetical protein CR513_04721, partial [Mucuna pruriens]
MDQQLFIDLMMWICGVEFVESFPVFLQGFSRMLPDPIDFLPDGRGSGCWKELLQEHTLHISPDSLLPRCRVDLGRDRSDMDSTEPYLTQSRLSADRRNIKPTNMNRKDWSRHLEAALWSHRTTYRTPLRMSPYRIFFGKACHLHVELEYRAYWAVKKCNMAYDQAGKERKLQLQELEELRLDAYENSRIYKQRVKQFHDRQILRKEFHVGQKVLLFKSRLRLIAGKLRSKWDGPFIITKVLPYGAVELQDELTRSTFQVNGQPHNNSRRSGKHLPSRTGHGGWHALSNTIIKISSIVLLCIEDNASFKCGGVFLRRVTPKARKTIINLNLKEQRSFEIVLGRS